MNTNNLKKALKMLRSATEGVTLDDRALYIEFAGPQIKLAVCTDTARGKVSLDVDDVGYGNCYVDIDSLLKILNSCNTSEIKLKLEANKEGQPHLQVKYARSRFKVTTFEHTFAKFTAEFKKEKEIVPKNLVATLRQVATFCNPNSLMENLRGVYANGKLVFVGDTTKILIYKENQFKDDYFIYYPMIRFLDQIDTTAMLSVNDNFVRVRNDNFEFAFDINRTIQAPNATRFLEMKASDASILPFEALKELSSSLSIMNPDRVLIAAKEGTLGFTAQDTKSQFDTSIDSKFKKDFSFPVDTKSLRESIKVMSMDEQQEVKMEVFGIPDIQFFRLTSGNLVQILSVAID